jgi:hypothetical protein
MGELTNKLGVKLSHQTFAAATSMWYISDHSLAVRSIKAALLFLVPMYALHVLQSRPQYEINAGIGASFSKHSRERIDD